MKVIFIAGLGRSGSNLLDLLLDSHSQVSGLGEIRRLPGIYENSHKSCSCGVSFRDCKFWSQVNEVMKEKFGREISSLNLDTKDTATFDQDNRMFFESVAGVCGTYFVTDNSKRPRRLRQLLAASDIDVYPVHVLRDPRGYAHSQTKRKQQYIGPALSYTFRSINLYQLLRNREHVVVEYEQLARDPEKLLRKLMYRLGLEFEPQLLNWAEHVHHNMGSAKSVLRKTNGSSIRADNAWHNNIPKYKQAIINLIALPGRILNKIKKRRWGLDIGQHTGTGNSRVDGVR